MYTFSEFCEKVGLHRNTILNLEKQGIIKPLRTPGGFRRFTDEHVKQVFEYFYKSKKEVKKEHKKTIVYCRVSTGKQKEYLKNQISMCKEFAAKNGITVDEVIFDISSSFNFKRKGLMKIIDMIISYQIDKIIIYDIDRLSRIAYSLFEELFRKFNVEIIIVDKSSEKSPDKIDEIKDELISFIHYITSKIYGRRSYKKKLEQISEEIKKYSIKDVDESFSENK